MAQLRHLAQTEWLAERLDDPSLRIFDCTTKLEPPAPGSDAPYEVVSGRADYDAAHIPGAGFLDVQGELSDPDARLPFTAPSKSHFAAAMSRHGVGEGAHVVLYSAGTPAWATRVWWLLRLFGFDDAAVLDGGWERWLAEGRSVSQVPADYPPATFVASEPRQMLATKDDVLASLADDASILVNTLPEELFRGNGPSRYGRPGRIPGSRSVPYSTLTDPERGTFRSVGECEALIAERIGDRGPFITYCGGGITATMLDFVLAGLGRDPGRLYDGSLSEWAPDESLPLERG